MDPLLYAAAVDALVADRRQGVELLRVALDLPEPLLVYAEKWAAYGAGHRARWHSRVWLLPIFLEAHLDDDDPVREMAFWEYLMEGVGNGMTGAGWKIARVSAEGAVTRMKRYPNPEIQRRMCQIRDGTVQAWIGQQEGKNRVRTSARVVACCLIAADSRRAKAR